MSVDALRRSLNDDVVALGQAWLERDGAELLGLPGFSLENLIEIASRAAQQGEDDLARALCRRFRDLGGDPAIALFEAFLELPQISPSAAATTAALDRLGQRLAELEAAPPRTSTPLLAYPNMAHFRLSYIDVDARPYIEALARILRAACPALAWVAPHCEPGAQVRGGPLRIGVDFDFPADHAMSVCFRDIIAAIAESEAEVVLIAQKHAASVAAQFPDVPCIALPEHPQEAMQRIAALELDLLVYTEIGMRVATYIRAHARLARKQLVLGGHPMTTGLPTIDGFISFDYVEPADGEAHYTEPLIRLPATAEVMLPPVPEEVPDERALVRQALGVPDGMRLYYAPHYIIKMQPEADALLRRVLEADPDGVLLLYGSGTERQLMALETRLAETMGEAAHRVFFQPGHLPTDDFYRVLRSVDAVLDIRPFGLGSTAYYAAHVGTPIVTWPGRFLRGRVAQGVLRACGLEGFVATDADDYVAKAVMVATDRSFASVLRRTLRTGFLRALPTLHQAAMAVVPEVLKMARTARGGPASPREAYLETRGLAERILARPDVPAEYLPALANECLAYGLNAHAARVLDRHAFATGPGPWDLHRALLAVPQVPASRQALDDGIVRCLDGLAALEAGPPYRIDDPVMFFHGMPHFTLGYAGIDVTEINARIGRLLLRWCPDLDWTAPHCGAAREPGPPRIGLHFNYDPGHVMSLSFKAMLAGLAEAGVRPVVFSHGHAPSLRALPYAIDVVELTGGLEDWRQAIAAHRLDVLLYSEIGMQVSSYLLGFARLARVQAVLSNHPVTTGLPRIDQFVSFDDLEPADAAEHYSETLVRLPRLLSLPLPAPVQGGGERARFGLPEDAHLYYFPHNAHKVHPDVDPLLQRIFAADPKGVLVMAMLGGEHCLTALRDRLAGVLGGRERILWHPMMPPEALSVMLQSVDVLLDLPHFGAGITAFHAAQAGCPVVTRPGRFARGRTAYALYRTLGILETVAEDDDAYVAKALALAADAQGNGGLRQRIRDAYAAFSAAPVDGALGRHLLETAQAVAAAG